MNPIVSESEALRRLNLPPSQRPFLREKLPHAPLGRTVAYQRIHVEALAAELKAKAGS